MPFGKAWNFDLPVLELLGSSETQRCSCGSFSKVLNFLLENLGRAATQMSHWWRHDGLQPQLLLCTRKIPHVNV